MSEYQFYEFQAIDRLLTQEEMAVIRSISSRAVLTASAAIFTYNYKDFPADEEMILAQYYDAMLSLTSWGQRRLMFRFPEQAVDFEALGKYAAEDVISIHRQGKYVLLDCNPYNEEPSGEWLEGAGLLSSMVSLRSDILSGDFRTLYLVWLAGVDAGIHEEEDLEPPVPDGLGNLNHAHHTLIKFFEIDQDLIESAAAISKASSPTPEFDVNAQLALLSVSEKDDFLLRLANAEPGLPSIFRKRLQSLSGKVAIKSSLPQRSVVELEQLANSARERRIAAEKAEKEKARMLKLSKVAKNKDALWREAYFFINRRKVADYDSAVNILLDLKAAAETQGDCTAFDQQMAQVCKEFKSLSSLKAKLKAAGLAYD
jgi:hypothetical protein